MSAKTSKKRNASDCDDLHRRPNKILRPDVNVSNGGSDEEVRRKDEESSTEEETANPSWAKEARLNLTCDKTKILKEELDRKGLDSTDLPRVKQPQLHKGKEVNKARKERISSVDPAAFKALTMRKLEKLIMSGASGNSKRKKLRKLEGYMEHVLDLKEAFDNREAEKIVDIYLATREREGIHPLQTAVVKGCSLARSRSVMRVKLFAYPALKQALAIKGFYLNLGPFSASESMLLMKNFKKFLADRSLLSGPEDVWKIISQDFANFYQKTKLFLHVGEGLSRASEQLYNRIKELFHTCRTGAFDVKSDAVILERVKKLEAEGVHRKFRVIGNEIDRFHRSVMGRYNYLNEAKTAISKDKMRNLVEAIARHQHRSQSSINVDEDSIPFDEISKLFGSKSEDGSFLRGYWLKEGKRRYQRSILPRWTRRDSLRLLEEIEAQEEEDENCIDFPALVAKFRGKVVDWQHLREHYNRTRRIVPYYTLKDLTSVLTIAKKELERRIAEGKEEEEQDDDEEKKEEEEEEEAQEEVEEAEETADEEEEE